MPPYSPQDINEARSILEARFGVRLRYTAFEGLVARDHAGQRIDMGSLQFDERDFFDLVDEIHRRRNPAPAPTPSQGGRQQRGNPFNDLFNNPLGHAATSMMPQGTRQRFRSVGSALGTVADMLPDGLTDAASTAGRSMASVVPRQAWRPVAQIGRAFGLSAPASIGLAGAAVVGAGAALTISNLQNVHETGQQIVGALVSGVRGAVGGVMDAGRSIGGVLLGAALQPFGRTGSAVGGVVNSVTGTAMGAVSGGLGILGGAAQSLGGAAALGGGIALTGIGLGVGALAGGPLGAVIGAVVGSGLALLAAKVLSVFSGLFGSLLEAAGKFAGEFGKFVGQAFSALIEIVKDVVNSAMEFSRNALNIAQRSGLGIGAASSSIINSMGFGVGQGEAVGAFSKNVMFARPLAAAFGVQGEIGSGEFMASFREQYQRRLAMMGGNPLLANQMAGAMGMDAFVPMANLPGSIFNRQMERTSQMKSAFGMSDDDITRTQQNFGMLMASFSQFVELFKTKIGAELLPWLTAGLDKIVAYVSQNSGKIAEGIKTGVQWLVTELPPLVAKGVAGVARGIAWVIESFENLHKSLANMGKGGGFMDSVETFLFAMDSIAEYVKQVSAVWIFFGKVLLDFGKTLYGVVTLIPQLMANIIGKAGSMALRAAGKDEAADWVDENMAALNKNMGLSVLKSVFNTGNAEQYNKLFERMGLMSPADPDEERTFGTGAYNAFTDFRANMKPVIDDGKLGFADQARDAAAKADAWGNNWRDNMTKNFDEMNQNIRKMTGAMEKGQNVNVRLAVEEKEDALWRLKAEVAEDVYLDANR